jgi:hypothetical protein
MLKTKCVWALLLFLLLTAGVGGAAEWLTFGHDPQRTGWAFGEREISPETASDLKDYRLKPVGSDTTESRGLRLKPSEVFPAQSRLKARWARLS